MDDGEQAGGRKMAAHKGGGGDMKKGLGAAYHTYSLEERRVFCKHINALLKDDPDLAAVDLPMDPNTNDLFVVASKGILLWYKLLGER